MIHMDIGKAGDNYFINIAAGGLLTELTYDVPSDLKTIFGYLAYLVKGAELLPRIKPIQMDLKYDGGEFKGKASMFFLALTNSVGGFEQIVPDASLDDGKFTLIIVKTSNLVEILHLVSKVLNGGKHVDDPRIIYKKVRKVTARPVNDPMQINLDGEYGGNAPMTFVDLKQHIEFFLPTRMKFRIVPIRTKLMNKFVKLSRTSSKALTNCRIRNSFIGCLLIALRCFRFAILFLRK